MNNRKLVIKKIRFTKEQQKEIDLINKGEAFNIVKTRIDKNGIKHDVVYKKRITYETGLRRLTQIYGGKCGGCGDWPSHKIMYDVGGPSQGAWLVYRYCQTCFDKRGYNNKK